MASQRQLDQAQQDGFDRFERYDATSDPADLRGAADIWRWIAQETSDLSQRTFVLAAISVAMRRYYDTTHELWALRDAVESGRAAVRGETARQRWLSACIYLGIADYEYFKATQERSYLDDAFSVLRAASGVATDTENRSNVLSHLGAALTIAWEYLHEEVFLVEAVDVGREAIRMPGPLQMNSALDLMRNLRNLGDISKDVKLLRESESVARWAQGTGDNGLRGLVLFELARTLDDIAEKVDDLAICADAVAAGDASVELARDPVEQRLRNVVIDGIRRRLRKSSPGSDYALPPT